MHSKLVLCNYKVLIDLKLWVPNDLMPCDKDFGHVRVTWGLTCGCYNDLWHNTQLTCVAVSKTTFKDYLIVLHEFLVVTKHMPWVALYENCSKMMSKLLASKCKVTFELYYIYHDLNIMWFNCDLISMHSTKWTKNFKNKLMF